VPRVAILMPVYDEGDRLERTLADIAEVVVTASDVSITVFVVDDGSAVPVSEAAVADAARGVRVVLSRHVVNLGQGAALETARRLALDPRWSDGAPFDAFVTMDADGQHAANDALALARAVVDGADVALGDRFAGASNVPTSRRALLAVARVFERAATGLRLSDAHNGLRAFGPRAIATMRLRQNRMAHATELTRRISQANLRVVEVPVSVRYTDESLAKGQNASGAITIVADLFRGFLFGDG
jgi:polyprenyl-phospho-N-acetylgalactosaminyl synthase